MKAFIKIQFVLFLVIFCFKIAAQDNIGIKYFGLTLHPKGDRDNAFLMPNKLDKNGYLVVNLGAEVLYEKFFYKDYFSVKVIQALYADCAERLGGFSHVGIRGRFLNIGRHRLYGGFGPSLMYRRNWMELDGYVNLKRLKGNSGDRFQYIFMWYGGEFEYEYRVSKHIDLAVSLIPGYPVLMNLAVGINYRLN
jgi:hypothetical protein